MMKKIVMKLPKRAAIKYPILIGEGYLHNWQSWVHECCNNRMVVIISDTIVATLYAQKFTDELNAAGYRALLLTVPPGEDSKTAGQKEKLEFAMFEAGCDKHSICIAIGGGIIGDLAGFVASTYMRGIKYIQVPTTLLAMLDSSVGGKTAINNRYGKNLIGSFYQPEMVIMDTTLLASLPRTQLINGLNEAIKIFLTSDAKSFNYVEKHLDAILNMNQVKLQYIISKAVSLKVRVVQLDEREDSLRMILNFGHTIGHAIERLTNFTLLHGYAVGLGMLVEARIACLRGSLDIQSFTRLKIVLSRLGLTSDMLASFSAHEIIAAAAHDKKNSYGRIYAVLLSKIGAVQYTEGRPVTEITLTDVELALSEIKCDIAGC